MANDKSTQMLTCVHHINFLVADLDAAVERYKELFDLDSIEVESLPERGVITGRFALAGIWIVLVQPVGDDSEPARVLREQGEGVFLISFAVDNLERAKEILVAKGAMRESAMPRDGLLNWRVIDLNPASVFGASIQLTEEL
jgi:methylmalonyl-CoA/ethylmalonyl-CoA epimerase